MTKSVFKSEKGRLAIQRATQRFLDEAPFSFETHELPTPRGRTHVIEAGPKAAPALLLLHGTASNSAGWLADIPAWAEDFRVFAVDRPGEPGLSEDRRLRLANDDVPIWLASLADTLGLETFGIVGMSLGAWAGLRFAISHPQRVEALSLIATSGLASAKRRFLLRALPLLLLGDWGADRLQRMICHGVELPREVSEFGRLVNTHYRPMLEPVPVFGDDELRALKMPIQYFGGVHDALLRSKESAQRLTKLCPHAQINLLQDAGHVIIGKTEAIGAFMGGA